MARAVSKTVAFKLPAVLTMLILVGGSGCCSVRPASGRQTALTRACETKAPAAKLIKNKPRHRPTTRQKLNPVFWFGNLDDPEPPEWYRHDDPARSRKWYGRNALHNFTFYVVGIADKEFAHMGRYPGELFNPHGGWNWTVCRYHWLWLPLISYRSDRILFYAGWRTRGNFGLKLNFRDARPKAAK